MKASARRADALKISGVGDTNIKCNLNVRGTKMECALIELKFVKKSQLNKEKAYNQTLSVVIEVKCTVFWHNRGLRVYFNLYASDFVKKKKKLFIS